MDEDTILTIEEVAKYLRVSERTVYDWAQKGEIPSGKIGTVWRFKKTDIEKWVNDRLSPERLEPIPGFLQAKTILSPDRVLFLNHTSKQEVLKALAENLSGAPQIKNSRELTAEILKREELMSTAIGRGIAIPHVRLASVTDLVMSVGISSVEITDFNPLDDMPVRLIFMIAAGVNQHSYYLKTLSFFAIQLKNRELRDSLLGAKNGDEVYNLLLSIFETGNDNL